MSAVSLPGLLQVGIDILNTVLGANPQSQTGTILAQTGDVVKGTTDCDNAEWWQHVGLASRPSNPQGGKAACQAVAWRSSDRDIVICSRDVRTNQIYGNLAPGETCIFAAGSDGNAQGRALLKADGSVTLYTTDDNTAAGNAVYLRIHPTKGLSFVAPFGTLTFDQSGLRVQHQNGFSILGGGIGGLPPPASAIGSYLYLAAAITKVEGAQTYLGNGEIGFSPAAWGLAENPLTMPLVPICPAGFGVPCGLFTSNSVRIGMT